MEARCQEGFTILVHHGVCGLYIGRHVVGAQQIFANGYLASAFHQETRAGVSLPLPRWAAQGTANIIH